MGYDPFFSVQVDKIRQKQREEALAKKAKAEQFFENARRKGEREYQIDANTYGRGRSQQEIIAANIANERAKTIEKEKAKERTKAGKAVSGFFFSPPKGRQFR